MKKILLYSALVLSTIFIGCNEKEGEPVKEPVTNVKLNDFVWKAMNNWYNWQSNVPNLADSKTYDTNSYYKYLKRYDSPKDLFESLLFKYKTVDRFSWFIPDYVEQQKSFQGIDKSFGMEINLTRISGNSDDLIIYIQYVSPNSPAAAAGVKRGDIINAINGKVLNVNNYKTALADYYDTETVEFTFVENNGFTVKEKKTITKAEVADNPVALTKVLDVNGTKVGYLVYNGFRSSFNDELNTAFLEFKNAGIQELVLDLRLNGGGSVESAAYLASMIYSGSGKFAELTFNNKNTSQNTPYGFENTLDVRNTDGEKTGTETINRVSGLTKLYVLTSRETASSSEAIINGLKPFMEVKTVGTTTYGKNVGSITLYDSPKSGYVHPKYLYDSNSNKKQIIKEFENKTHKNALQPIVFTITNSQGKGDYSTGFKPTILVEEFKSWSNILPFGDENEVVLKAALNDIKGVSARSVNYINNSAVLITKGIKTPRFKNEMYVEDSSVFFKK